jgi:uncharacterized delta-60 repeat protein
VIRSGNLKEEARVNYATSNGTATAGLDYLPSSGVLVFGPGETRQTFAVAILDDTLVEENETVNLDLFSPQGNAVLGLPRATLTIVDDDFAPGVMSFATASLLVSEAAGQAMIAVRRVSGHTGVVTIDYASRNGTALAGEDYVPVQGTLIFAEGETSKSFVLPIIDDNRVEPDETVILVLSNPTGGALLGVPGTNIVTIVNDDLGAGSLDLGFDPERGADGPVRSVRVQKDGRILIGGDFMNYNRIARPRVARLHLNGTLDSTLTQAQGPNNPVTVILPQSNGQLLVAGDFNSFGEVLRNRVARLNADGSIDSGFNLPLGLNALVQSAVLQPDGKMVLGGFFDRASAAGRNRIARLQANGNLDVTFDPGEGANQAVYAVAVQEDGKIVLGGAFTAMNNAPRGGVARLHANGAVDAGFMPGTGANGPIYAVLVQEDGRIVVAGNFTMFNGVSRNRIARLHPNGTLENGFNPEMGMNNSIYALGLQSDGKIFIGGDFTLVNGVPRNRIARLNANGSLDSTFDPGAGANSSVFSIAVQPDGNVLVAGQFSQMDGVSRNGVARLMGDLDRLPAEVRVAFVSRLGGGQTHILFNTHPGRIYHVEASYDLVVWSSLGTVLANGTTGDFLDAGSANFPHRFYRIRRNP